jgi:transcriptional regulator with XRE-family HTH domain
MVKLIFHLPLKQALREARKQAGATQADIAERAGLSLPTVRLLERGKGTIESLDAYLDCLDLEIYGDRLPRSGSRGERIAALRKARRISQRSLADKINVTPPPIITIEKHWRGRVETLDAILSTLEAGAYLAPVGFDPGAAISNAPQFRSAESVMNPLHNALGRFDLSPCPAEISGRQLPVKAGKEYAATDDPLHLPWAGTVFLNPPYTDDLPAWVKKAYDEYESGNASLLAAFLPAFTDRPWWHQYVAGKAAVVFLRGMIAFENGESHAMPSALVIWGATGKLLDKIEQAYPESWVIRPKK